MKNFIRSIFRVVLGGLVISGVPTLYYTFYYQPNIDLEIILNDTENQTTNAKVIVQNNGRAPATELKLNLKPQSDILSHNVEFVAEDIEKLKLVDPRWLRVEMPRLTHGTEIRIDTLLNSTKITTTYNVFAVYDQGSATKKYDPSIETETERILDAMTLAIFAGWTVAVIIVGIVFFWVCVHGWAKKDSLS